jgi:integrase
MARRRNAGESASGERKRGRRRAQSEGLVRERSDGRWEGRISLGWRDGRRLQRSYYGATQAEVLSKLTKARNDVRLGLPVAANRQPVADFLTRWLEESAGPRIKPRTYERFSELIRLHVVPTLGRIRLEKLTPAHVQRLLIEKRQQGLAAQTVVSIRNVIRAALNQALRWGEVARNVATLVDAPRIERPAVRVLSAEEANRLLESAKGERFEAVYSVGLALGLRRGELLGLTWRDVDFDGAQLRVVRSLQRIGGRLQLTETKTPKSRRTVPLPQYAIRALRSHRVRQFEERLATGSDWQGSGLDLVFSNRTGGPVEPVNLHRAYKRLLTKAGLPSIRFHNLRHSAASLMLAQGVPLKTIQEILGHSSIAVTSGFYAHLGEQLKREAADAMDRVLGNRS